jgi:hypothetical protein
MEKMIEEKDEPSKFIFSGELKSMEFTETIGKMDKNVLLDQEKRDKELIKIGKDLFKKHPVKKKKIVKIRIEKELNILSQQEIDELLTGKKGTRLKKLYRWLLVIYFKGERYKMRFPYKKIEYEDIKEIDRPYTKEVLSKEEIDMLLEEIKEG